MTGRERVLKTMRGEPVDSLANMAITMMKAAAEVGVPYRTYALDADVHVRGQMAVARKFDTDHVSCISDPGVEAADLGAEIIYREDAPPTPDESRPLIDEPSKLHRMRLPDPWSSPRMRKRLAVISQLKEQAAGEKAVEGWIEGPIAESADLRGVSRIMTDFYDSPSFVRDLIAFVVDVELAFGRAQVEAGADYIGIGDAAASLVGPDMYREFVFEAEKRYITELHRLGVPVRLHICGQTTPLLPMLKELGADLIDLDSMVSIAEARRVMGPKQVIAGNINPVSDLKDGTPQLVTEKLSECFRDAGETAWAVAAGCEVPPATPDDNFAAMAHFARAHALKTGT